MRAIVKAALAVALVLAAAPRPAAAAVGCSLSNPEADLRRFFAEMTDYTVNYLSFAVQRPAALGALEAALGDELDAVYETADVPYTLYTVFSRGEVIGHVFGANQRGTYSNIQVIAVAAADGLLREVYLQRIRSPRFPDFVAPSFTGALGTLPLGLYPAFRACYVDGACDDVPIPDPTAGEEAGDYRAILRALAKLHALRTLLLRPDAAPTDRDDALAEWIAARRDPRLRTTPAGELDWRPISAVGTELLANDPVVVVRHRKKLSIVPLWILARHGAAPLGGGTIVGWSPATGSFNVVDFGSLEGASTLLPSDGVLFGAAVFTDHLSRSRWVLELARAVDGVQAGTTAPRVGGAVRMRWRDVAERLPPDTRVAWDDRAEAGRFAVAALRRTNPLAGDPVVLLPDLPGPPVIRLEALRESGARRFDHPGGPVWLAAVGGGAVAWRARPDEDAATVQARFTRDPFWPLFEPGLRWLAALRLPDWSARALFDAGP